MFCGPSLNPMIEPYCFPHSWNLLATVSQFKHKHIKGPGTCFKKLFVVGILVRFPRMGVVCGPGGKSLGRLLCMFQRTKMLPIATISPMAANPNTALKFRALMIAMAVELEERIDRIP